MATDRITNIVFTNTFTCTRGTRFALNRATVWSLFATKWFPVIMLVPVLLIGTILWANRKEPSTALFVGEFMVGVLAIYFGLWYFLGIMIRNIGGWDSELSRYNYARNGKVLESGADSAEFVYRSQDLGVRSFRFADVKRIVVHTGGVVVKTTAGIHTLPLQLFDDAVIEQIRQERTAGH